MQKIATKRLFALAGIAGSLVWAAAANATTISVGVDAGSGIATVVNAAASPVLYIGVDTGANGTFSDTIIAVGPNGNDLLNSSAVDVNGSGPGPVTVYITLNGLTSSGVLSFLSTFTTNRDPYASVTEATYIDSGDGVFATTTPLSSVLFTGGLPGNNADTKTLDPGATYSLTEVFTVTLPANGGNATSTIDVELATPLPAALPLFGSVLGGGLFIGKFRRRRKA